MLCLATLLIAACKKKLPVHNVPTTIKSNTKHKRNCDYYALTKEPTTGFFHIYEVYDGATSFSSVLTGATDAVVRVGSGTPFTDITGIANAGNGNFIVTTGPNDANFPNQIFSIPISNINNASYRATMNTGNTIVYGLSDIEYDGNGTFYAIDRDITQGDIPLVSINVTTGNVNTVAPNPTMPNNPTWGNEEVMGLAFDYIGDIIYLARPTGTGVDEESISYDITLQNISYSPTNGLCADIDVATSGKEMGYHYFYQGGVTPRHIAMSANTPTTPNNIFVGLPCIAGGTGLGGVTAFVKPCIDFCRN